MIDWQAIPAGPFAMGDDPARLYPPDEDEMPRRVVALEAFRIGRVPVTGDDDVGTPQAGPRGVRGAADPGVAERRLATRRA